MVYSTIEEFLSYVSIRDKFYSIVINVYLNEFGLSNGLFKPLFELS